MADTVYSSFLSYNTSFTATGTTKELEIGFVPNKIELFDRAGTTKVEWTRSMGAGKGFSVILSGASDDATNLSAGGVTGTDKDYDYIGVYCGANIITSGHTYDVIAYR